MIKINDRFTVNPGGQSLRVLTLDEARAKLGNDFNRSQFERYGGKKLKLYNAQRIDVSGNGKDFILSFSADGDDTYRWHENMFKDYWDAGVPAKKVAKAPASKASAERAAPKAKNDKMKKFIKFYFLSQLLGK